MTVSLVASSIPFDWGHFFGVTILKAKHYYLTKTSRNGSAFCAKQCLRLRAVLLGPARIQIRLVVSRNASTGTLRKSNSGILWLCNQMTTPQFLSTSKMEVHAWNRVKVRATVPRQSRLQSQLKNCFSLKLQMSFPSLHVMHTTLNKSGRHHQ